MANKFVWSGAGGANDGSSWDNAYTTLMRDWGAEGTFTPASDFIYVRSVHSESTNSALTITGSTAEGTTAPCRVICVVGDTTGTTPGNLATGASVSTITTTSNDIHIIEGLYIYGVEFYSIDDINIGVSSTDHDIVLENCRLELTGVAVDRISIGNSGTGVGTRIKLVDVTLDFGAAGQGIFVGGGTDIQWIGGSIAFDVAALVAASGAIPNVFRISGVDLSVMTSSAIISGSTASTHDFKLILSRCLLATGASIVNGTIDVPGFRVESYHCQIGTDADPAYQMEINDSRGKIDTATTPYRTGGASDGERTNPISWDFDTTAGSVRGYPGHALEGPPITAWTDGDGTTPHTYRVSVASSATLNDDEVWMEVEGPNDAATNSMAVINTTRVAPETTATALTTDSGSTWSDGGLTKQYMQVSYTPDKPGPVTIRVFVAKASATVYVDPKIQIDP